MILKLFQSLIYCVLAVLCLYCGFSFAFFTTIEPYEEQCYHENIKRGQVWGFLYEVSEGGFLDIDAKLTAPDGNQMYGQEKKTDDSYFFTAEQEGKYVFCLANQKSSLVPKSVYFMFDFLNDEKRFDEGEGGQNKTEVDKVVGELSVELMKLRRTQVKQNVRMETHFKINLHTNQIVSWWSFFEFILIIGMAIGQVYYIKHFFEVRRVI
ncbi:transmembrane emp24 domain-containing protein 2-like isoform X2 [Xenia sp. Carnegie-2017]|uniref:transmembrane emp24 domain-containing protein 2-like isoform X2 n=1 Tax=Xenia sp. Carnegie-2017 TaxID=2897299 RepID=UPI001F0424B9|nr:transmembrane emp24 domain-containing protein 2-like isoform X2 [Xenia sp. Carnegie-2017]